MADTRVIKNYVTEKGLFNNSNKNDTHGLLI